MHIMLSSLTVQTSGPHKTLGAQAQTAWWSFNLAAGLFASVARRGVQRCSKCGARGRLAADPALSSAKHDEHSVITENRPLSVRRALRLASLSPERSGPPSIEKIKLVEVFIEAE